MDNQKFAMFSKFSNGLFKYAIDAFLGADNKNKEGNMMLIIALVLAVFIFIALIYAGVEVVKLLFRKNFGKQGVSMFRVVLCAIAFFALAGFCYVASTDYTYELESLGTKESFFYASIFFLFLGLIVFIKGILSKVKNNENVPPIYRGDSSVLGFLIKGGWSQSLVQDLAEPLFFLALGVYLLSFNFIWGLPVIFSAVSTWLHLGIESVFGFFDERSELSNKGYAYTHNREFSKVI